MPVIRDATGDDAAALLELSCALYTEAGGGEPVVRTSPDRLARDLDSGRARGLIAEHDGALVGFALYSFMHFSLSGEHIYLDDLYVVPGHRSGGLGRRLMAVLAARAKARGCAGMTWFVERDNARAIEFYRRLGADMAESRAIMSTLDLDRLATSSEAEGL